MAARNSLFYLLLSGLLGTMHGNLAAQKPADLSGRYLAPLASAEQAVAALPPQAWQAYGPERTPELRDKVLGLNSQVQALGTARAFAGDTDGAIHAFDLLSRSVTVDRSELAGPLAQIEQARAEDAIQAIVAQARTKQVVILNEAHHVPMHRAFAMKLAAALRKIGYSYLACETFSSMDGDMSTLAPGQAIVSTGYFAREPVFAGFINAALADGWKPVAYEPMSSPDKDMRQRIRQREEGQARNLVERIFARDKHAKVLIYVGYAHVYRSRPSDPPGSIDWMAEYLRRMTGLDMLQVDQTEFYAHPDRRDESLLYAAMTDKFASREPFVLRAPDGSHPVLPGTKGKIDLQGRVDMQVVFPRYAMRDGRPEWLQALAGRSPREIPSELLPKQGRRVIKAFRTIGRPDAVPADVVLVEAGKPAPKLMLPAGEFRYEFEE
jgi:hypothetical protein